MTGKCITGQINHKNLEIAILLSTPKPFVYKFAYILDIKEARQIMYYNSQKCTANKVAANIILRLRKEPLQVSVASVNLYDLNTLVDFVFSWP